MAEGEVPPGVGGWLLFLCVILTIVVPIGHLYTIRTALRGHLDGVGITMVLVYLGFAAFSFISGFLLWRAYSNAVTAAKVFLIAHTAFAVILYARVLLAGNPTPALAQSLVADVLFRPFLFAIVWYAYLTKSRRVRSTYPNDYSVVTRKL